MTNTVELKNGIIEMVQVGDQTYDSVMDLNSQVEHLSQRVSRILILVDHTHLGKTDAGAREAAVKVAKGTQFDRMAMFGSPPYVKAIINMILRVIGRGTIRFFATREEALRWLRG